jgi:hypothetical protein
MQKEKNSASKSGGKGADKTQQNKSTSGGGKNMNIGGQSGKMAGGKGSSTGSKGTSGK